jgi:hypothetical protein
MVGQSLRGLVFSFSYTMGTEANAMTLYDNYLDKLAAALSADTSEATLSTHPKRYGATLRGTPNSSKRRVGVHKLTTFEPEKKMKRPESRAKVDSIKQAIQAGHKMPRIVTHGDMVIDGHHRLQAHKELGTRHVDTVSPGSVKYDR